MKTFPIQDTRGPDSVPWDVAAEAYKEYAAQYGTSQSMERIGERGGFGATEIAILLFQRIKRLQKARTFDATASHDSDALTDLITNAIDDAIRNAKCSSYAEWQALIHDLLNSQKRD